MRNRITNLIAIALVMLVVVWLAAITLNFAWSLLSTSFFGMYGCVVIGGAFLTVIYILGVLFNYTRTGGGKVRN